MSIINNPFDHTYKLLHHPKHLSDVIENNRPFPIHLEIDLTNVCNHSCSFCNMADTLATDNSIINYKILIERLKEAFDLGAKGISFTGGGEPTMHPQFHEISKSCKEIGFDLGLITNGSLIIKSKLDAVSKYFDWVRISLGGPTKESYKIIQGKDDFTKVLRNVFNLKENSERSAKINLGLKVMLTKPNIEVLDQMKKYLSDEGLNSNHVDYVQFVPDQYTSDGGEFVKSELVRKKMEKLKKDLKELGIPLYGSYYSVKSEDRNLSLSTKCYAHFYQLVITATGIVTFCKNSRDTKELHVGNIFESSFKEIWNSDKIKKLEENICSENCNTFCKSLKINNLIHSIKNPLGEYSENFF